MYTGIQEEKKKQNNKKLTSAMQIYIYTHTPTSDVQEVVRVCVCEQPTTSDLDPYTKAKLKQPRSIGLSCF